MHGIIDVIVWCVLRFGWNAQSLGGHEPSTHGCSCAAGATLEPSTAGILARRQARRSGRAPSASTCAGRRHANRIADDVRLLLERAVPQSVDGARCVRLVPLELIFTRVSAIGAGSRSWSCLSRRWREMLGLRLEMARTAGRAACACLRVSAVPTRLCTPPCALSRAHCASRPSLALATDAPSPDTHVMLRAWFCVLRVCMCCSPCVFPCHLPNICHDAERLTLCAAARFLSIRCTACTCATEL